MEITTIRIDVSPHYTQNTLPEPVVIGGNQIALVPKVGDTYLAPGFSILVRSRSFEFRGSELTIVLGG